VLGDNRINIRAMVIQDRGDFGIMKLLVNDPARARQILVEKGYAVALKQVLAVVVRDEAGGLNELLELFVKKNISIVDAYGFVAESAKKAVWCMEVPDLALCTQIVTSGGFKILSDAELYEL
jgi:hypothetical protein